jgi:hypothetical protein
MEIPYDDYHRYELHANIYIAQDSLKLGKY